jgi:hypothetical protein
MMSRGKRDRILKLDFFSVVAMDPVGEEVFWGAPKFQSAIGIAPGSFVKFWGKLLNLKAPSYCRN